MKRMERIYLYVKENTRRLSAEEILSGKSFETNTISDELKILRNNVSKELNELFRLDKIIKIKGRPVRFLDKEGVQEKLNISLKEQCIEIDSIKELLDNLDNNDPFDYLIGADKSLKNQVEQAKAAIVYPPDGLHTLILGNTGVGKTLFARIMYNYGKFVKRFSDKSPFIIFNCADYYSNPQLLLSHIFGYVKGAFTGAEQDREGLVEKAHGGILFLDEIHRLPPEGQEMLFYFMDTGTYNKLGETERKRSASILIIGATTEDPSSYMLKTFIRRIPVIIRIPSLQERTVAEKIDIIKYLFANEAHRVNRPIKISPEVVKALIGSGSYGNIGQLKSNIQLTCAKGFLGSINSSNNDCIELDFRMLSTDIKDGLFAIGRNHKEFEELGNLLEAPLRISPDGYKMFLEDSGDPAFNLYTLIEDKVSLLKQEGLDDNYIDKFITTDVHISIKRLYNRFIRDNRERILKVIDREILEFAERMKELAEQHLNRKYSERFTYALSFHLSAFFKRMKEKKYNHAVYNDHSIQIQDELEVALQIKNRISQTFQVDVPAAEVTYIAILLKSVEEERQGQVGIVVAAHGGGTASSMVDVVQKLLGDSLLCAVDMPLDVSPKEILEVIIDKVKIMDKGKGVLLLVDMGSLFKFEATIIERTGIQVKTLDMVSTPLVLEAVRKSKVFDMELEDIYASLQEFRGYNNEFYSRTNAMEKVIVTVCASGSGTAVKLQEFVEDILPEITREAIRVVTLGVRELDKGIKELQKKQEVFAVIGIKRPKASVPFIPLEQLLDGRGEQVLRQMVAGRKFTVLPPKPSVIVKDVCTKNLQQYLTFLNPPKIMGMLLEFVTKLETELDTEFENTKKIRIIMHLGCALERMVVRDGLKYVEDSTRISPGLFRIVDHACQSIEKALRIGITQDEKYYICELLQIEG
ncbi:hypothetical protein P22_0378 [Propionispora sp. 2/2-37]|nr:hypothetical protein P22_0378 [Propionispora sp. 2/2-37]